MGLFKRRSEDPGELERLRTGLGELRERLDESDAAKAELGSKIRSLTERMETPITAPPPEPPTPSAPPAVGAAELEAVRAQIARTHGAPRSARPPDHHHLDRARQPARRAQRRHRHARQAHRGGSASTRRPSASSATPRPGSPANKPATRSPSAKTWPRSPSAGEEADPRSRDPVTGSRRSEVKTRFGSRRRQPLRLPLIQELPGRGR